ncbi:MAG: hypothetical protein KIS66_00515 [Fimbriimonadaceae bacterium]|nr:hypothetical protein [Fimbriimonadaceae bacterium]
MADWNQRVAAQQKSLQDLLASGLAFLEIPPDAAIVCDNGHKYLYRDFRCSTGYYYSEEVQYFDTESMGSSTSASESWGSHTNLGSNTVGVGTFSTNGVQPVAVGRGDTTFRFGCPLCFTSRFALEDPNLMKFVKCPNGHYHDPQFSSCPVCPLLVPIPQPQPAYNPYGVQVQGGAAPIYYPPPPRPPLLKSSGCLSVIGFVLLVVLYFII